LKVINSIVFFGTSNLGSARTFYKDLIGLDLFKDQGKCLIFSTPGGGMLGFCNHLHDRSRKGDPIITLLTENVDEFHRKLISAGVVCTDPIVNEEFNIYHFFTSDPDGHRLEIQRFLEE